ncbi:50S ribosomal protein L32 [Listeria monocytogenes]|nr:50S ribosomal protein L32 [Listeria monocytogenes]
MAVPARRTSKAKKNKRRTHKGLTTPGLSRDSETGEYRMSHRISPDGTYKGCTIIEK